MIDAVLLWVAVWGFSVGSAGVALGPFALFLLEVVLGGAATSAAPDSSFPESMTGWVAWGVVLGAPVTAFLGSFAGSWLHLPVRDLGWGTSAYLVGVALSAALWLAVALVRSKATRRELHAVRIPQRDPDEG